jgi:predicted outer membrane repeat protein
MKEIRSRAIFHFLFIVSFLATLLTSAAFPIPVQAATLVVTSTADSGLGTLRQAVIDAAPNDTINFDTLLYDEVINLSSEIDINKDLTINGLGATHLTLNGVNPPVRIFGIQSATVIISGLTIANGHTDPAYDGGGINMSGGSLTVNNVVFTNNIAGRGGGIYNFGGSLTLNNVIFTSNQASGSGGAIYQNQGSLTITNSTFTGGVAGGDGGAIEAANIPLMISNSSFASNTASNYGGAIRWGSGATVDLEHPHTLTVLNTTFSNNHAARGSGINRVSDTSLGTTDRIANSTFSANGTDGLGGGLFSADGTLILTNNTFSANSASNGGGIYNSSANLDVINNTFSANSASSGGPSSGGGIYSQGGTLSLINSILANSTTGVDCYNDFGPWGTLSHNLIETGNCFVGDPSPDPMLSPLANNGGPTQTFALLSDSPAIDGGDNTYCAAAPVNNLDQRGQPRNDWACDVGSFELRLIDSHVVTKLITGTGVYTFGPTRVKVQVVNQGSLANLTITEVAGHHPGRTGSSGGSGVGWGEYFTLAPNLGADTFNATLTLPAQFPLELDDTVCRYIDQHVWDCAPSSISDTPFNIVSRVNVTAFSDWAVGYHVSPTAVRLISFRVLPLRSLGLLPFLGAVLIFGLAAVIILRRR